MARSMFPKGHWKRRPYSAPRSNNVLDDTPSFSNIKRKKSAENVSKTDHFEPNFSNTEKSPPKPFVSRARRKSTMGTPCNVEAKEPMHSSVYGEAAPNDIIGVREEKVAASLKRPEPRSCASAEAKESPKIHGTPVRKPAFKQGKRPVIETAKSGSQFTPYIRQRLTRLRAEDKRITERNKIAKIDYGAKRSPKGTPVRKPASKLGKRPGNLTTKSGSPFTPHIRQRLTRLRADDKRITERDRITKIDAEVRALPKRMTRQAYRQLGGLVPKQVVEAPHEKPAEANIEPNIEIIVDPCRLPQKPVEQLNRKEQSSAFVKPLQDVAKPLEELHKKNLEVRNHHKTKSRTVPNTDELQGDPTERSRTDETYIKLGTNEKECPDALMQATCIEAGHAGIEINKGADEQKNGRSKVLNARRLENKPSEPINAEELGGRWRKHKPESTTGEKFGVTFIAKTSTNLDKRGSNRRETRSKLKLKKTKQRAARSELKISRSIQVTILKSPRWKDANTSTTGLPIPTPSPKFKSVCLQVDRDKSPHAAISQNSMDEDSLRLELHDFDDDVGTESNQEVERPVSTANSLTRSPVATSSATLTRKKHTKSHSSQANEYEMEENASTEQKKYDALCELVFNRTESQQEASSPRNRLNEGKNITERQNHATIDLSESTLNSSNRMDTILVGNHALRRNSRLNQETALIEAIATQCAISTNINARAQQVDDDKAPVNEIFVDMDMNTLPATRKQVSKPTSRLSSLENDHSLTRTRSKRVNAEIPNHHLNAEPQLRDHPGAIMRRLTLNVPELLRARKLRKEIIDNNVYRRVNLIFEGLWEAFLERHRPRKWKKIRKEWMDKKLKKRKSEDQRVMGPLTEEMEMEVQKLTKQAARKHIINFQCKEDLERDYMAAKEKTKKNKSPIPVESNRNTSASKRKSIIRAQPMRRSRRLLKIRDRD